jgi:hypothetical protein
MRTLASRLRLVVAGLFAVVSLLQTPSMVFAGSGAPPTHHAGATVLHVHHGAMQRSHEQDTQDTADASYGLTACHVVGCCLALGFSGCGAPIALYLPIGSLDAAPARPIVAAPPDPADPPPRLQA